MDIVSIDSSLKKRADDVLTGLSETVGKATEIQGIQSSGLLDMTDGLASNAKACKDSLNACIESGECVCVRERERERVCVRERESVCVRERERERVCVCVFVW